MVLYYSQYGTLDEAMTATIDIYIALLTDLIASREFEIFVHPVPAVLNETRAVVRPFTAMLKQRVEAAARAKPALSRLHYLDFADALLTPDGAKLDPALAFDAQEPTPPAQDQPPAQAPPGPVPPPQAPSWGRWLDRDTNACFNFQRIGESMQRPLELCSWKDREALPPIGKEYQQGYKRVNDRLPKDRQRLHRAAEYRRGIDGRARNNA
ncbi:hypothetical protein QJQ45_026510 [Haematococcus lacustris]|nr:hypothetical protein QJQ45_026510 [Haematococcus lacustris]